MKHSPQSSRLKPLGRPPRRKPSSSASSTSTSPPLDAETIPPENIVCYYGPYVLSSLIVYLTGPSISPSVARAAFSGVATLLWYEVVVPYLVSLSELKGALPRYVNSRTSADDKISETPIAPSSSTSAATPRSPWEETSVVEAVLDHQFSTVIGVSHAARKRGAALQLHSFASEEVKAKAASLIDVQQGISLYGDIARASWRSRDKGEHVEVLTTQVAGSCWDVVVGTVKIEATVDQVVSLVADDSKRQKYDAMFKNSIEHRSVGACSSSIRTLIYSGIWPVSERYFTVLSGWRPHKFPGSEIAGAVVSTQSIKFSGSDIPGKQAARIHIG